MTNRLTVRDLDGNAHATKVGYYDIIDKLAEYEDAEEQGLLLRVKLKVGDTFWELNDNFLEPAIYPRKAHSLQHVLYVMDRLGKVTFLTYEEAEQKLAEMRVN